MMFDHVIPSDLGLPKKYDCWRPGQLESVNEVVQSGNQVFLLDAPTGSGKSLVGIAAFKRLTVMDRVMDRMTDSHSNYRCRYLTRTIQLQEQVLRDFDGKMVKGRSNYRCNTFPNLHAGDCPSDKKTDPGENRCEECNYHVAKSRAIQAPLAVLNNAYYITEVNGPKQFSGSNLVVIDEVDTLEASLMSFIDFEVTEAQLKKYSVLPPDNMESLPEWMAWAMKSTRRMHDYIGLLDKQLALDPEHWTDIEIGKNREKKQAEQFLAKMNMFLTEVNDTWILDVGSKPKAGWCVTFKPVTVAPYAEKYLWGHGDRYLGMSGTILDPQILADDLGIKDYSYRRMDSQFPVDNRLIHVKPVVNLKYAKMQEELPKLLDEVVNIVTEHRGKNILVHTVSYKIRDYLVEMLPFKGVDPERILTHNTMDRVDKLELFKKSRNQIMVSPSFDRGVDLPGQECEVVIICKMPYLALGDKQVKARLAMPRGQQWYNLRAIQTVMQMTGRAVRSERDFAATYILDKQFKSLLARTRHLIPKWWLESIREG